MKNHWNATLRKSDKAIGDNFTILREYMVQLGLPCGVRQGVARGVRGQTEVQVSSVRSRHVRATSQRC